MLACLSPFDLQDGADIESEWVTEWKIVNEIGSLLRLIVETAAEATSAPPQALKMTCRAISAQADLETGRNLRFRTSACCV